MIEKSPLQLYSAALVFSPSESIIRAQFQDCVPSWIKHGPDTPKSWSAVLQALGGHSESINAMVFSPDGKILASASNDYTVRLWNCKTGALHVTLEHSHDVNSLAFSPDGSLLASITTDTIQLWNPITGKQQGCLDCAFPSFSGLASCVSFSSDGRLLVVRSRDGEVQFWDPIAQEQRSLLGHLGLVRAVVFSPKGHLLASVSDDIVQLWDSRTGEPCLPAIKNVGKVTAIAFSHDGEQLASSSHEGYLQICNSATGTATFFGKRANAYDKLCFSPDGNFLAALSSFGRFELSNTVTGELYKVYIAHSGKISAVVFPPNGNLFASAHRYSNMVILWDTASLIESADNFMDHSSNSPLDDEPCINSQLPVSTSENETEDYRSLQSKYEHHEFPITTIKFSSDGCLVASGAESLIIRNTKTRELCGNLIGNCNTVYDAAFSPDGNLLASVSLEGDVELWDVGTGKMRGTISSHRGKATDVIFTPDGNSVASAHASIGTIIFWDATTMKQKMLFKCRHNTVVNAIAISPDGKSLACATSRGKISTDGKSLICATSRGKGILWDLATGEILTVIAYPSSANAVSFSHDGRTLAYSNCRFDVPGDISRIWLWDMEAIMRDHSNSHHGRLVDYIKAEKISPGDKLQLCISVSPKALAGVYNAGLGKAIFAFRSGSHQRAIERLSFSPVDPSLQKDNSFPQIDPFLFRQNLVPSIPLMWNISQDWICFGIHRILWLPIDSRPDCINIRGNTITLGLHSGRVLMIDFNPDKILLNEIPIQHIKKGQREREFEVVETGESTSSEDEIDYSEDEPGEQPHSEDEIDDSKEEAGEWLFSEDETSDGEEEWDVIKGDGLDDEDDMELDEEDGEQEEDSQGEEDIEVEGKSKEDDYSGDEGQRNRKRLKRS
jgi:WD40 repeat protein